MRCNQAAGALQAWGLLLIWDAEPEDLHEKTTTVEVELTDTSAQIISVSVLGKGMSADTKLELQAVADGRVCYAYTVGEAEAEKVKCD